MKRAIAFHSIRNNRNLSGPRSLPLVALLFVMGAQVVWSSVGGSISGVIKDPNGGVVPGVIVVALNTETGVRHTASTDAVGFYAFPILPIGRYEIDVRHSGFKEYRQTGLVINANSALRVDVTLEVGAATQEVTVSSTAVHVETANTQMGEVIGTSKMTTLPLNGRSYTDLLALQPGVVPRSATYSDPGNVSVNGQRESANGFMVNGGNVQEGLHLGTAIIPNLDSLAEFRILTNNSDAEYGNYSGGQVNAVTKAGTNAFHGNLFEFLRNTNLDARNFFSPGKGKFIQNQFGGTFGGPLRHDKVFFLGDYQGTRRIVGVSTGLRAVPSLRDRTGDLSDVASQLKGKVRGAFWAKTLSQRLGYAVSAGEPYFTSGCVTAAQCVFPNAIIPQSVWSAPAGALLKFIPEPNVAGGFFSTSAFNQTAPDNKGSARVDANTGWGTLSAYYFVDKSTLNDPYPSANVPGFSAITPTMAQMFNLSDTKSFGGSAVNEFRFHYIRRAILTGEPLGGVGPKLSSLGFVEGAGTLGIVPQNPQIEGVPNISFNSFTIGTKPGFNGQFNNTFQWLDNYSKVTGTQTLKFGGSFHYDQINILGHDFNNGIFRFRGNETGQDFADFLLGAPSTFIQGFQLPLYTRSKYVGLYGQDSWRARSDLTLNYGLRWEVSQPWYEQHNQLETIVPGKQSVVFPGAPKGWVFPGDPGIPSTIAPTRYNNFGPRIGLAYSPSAGGGFWGKLFGGHGKTSIRASYGLFYTAIEDLTDLVVSGDAPYGFFYVSPAPPLFETPFVDRGTGRSEGQRFPVPFPPLNVSASNPDPTVDWSQFVPISSSPGYFIGNQLPYAEHYMYSLQRQFGSNTLLAVSYVGTQGHRLIAVLEANPGNPALCLSLSQPGQLAPGSPACGPFGEDDVYTTASGQLIQGTRAPLGPLFGSNGYLITMANSNYNALQVSLRHTSGRLEFLAGYTYGKSLDNASVLSQQINPVNFKISKALSSFDMAHNFVFSYRYEMPFDKLFSGHERLTRGWVLTGITRFATGLPVTLTEPDDHSLLGTDDAGIGASVDVPNFTPGPVLNNTDPRSRQPYFNTSLFTREPIGQLGTANRRFFHGPGINNFDMAFLKDLRMTETKTVEFRGEFFNIFNHAQFGNPVGNMLSRAFGLVTGAGSPRIAQVAIKILF